MARQPNWHEELGVKRDAAWHEILGVSSTASQEEIETARKELTLKYHPDRCKLACATEIMQAINDAYAEAKAHLPKNETSPAYNRRSPAPRSGFHAREKISINWSEARAGLSHRISGVLVDIPPGIEDGAEIRVAGKGKPGARGGKPGDLIVTVQVKSTAAEREDTGAVHTQELTADYAVLLAKDEHIKKGFRLSHTRETLIFTDRRLLLVKVDSYSKRYYLSIPYTKITMFQIESQKGFSLTAKLQFWIDGQKDPIEKKFNSQVNIYAVQRMLAQFIGQ